MRDISAWKSVDKLKLIVVSDSHMRKSMLNKIIEKINNEGADGVIHLGDMMDDARYMEARMDIPVISVAGKCDGWGAGPLEILINAAGRRIIACHGHEWGVKYSTTRLSYHRSEVGAAIALYGHTHAPKVELDGTGIIINPGALKDGLYAELKLTGKDVVPRILEL